MSDERVEAIRRRAKERATQVLQAYTFPRWREVRDAIARALVQAERERDDWENQASQLSVSWNDAMRERDELQTEVQYKHDCIEGLHGWRQLLTEARAEVERLKASVTNAEIGRQNDYELWQKAEAALARVRAVVREYRVSSRIETQDVLDAVEAALEGR